MSGIEVAGLVFGVLPILIEAVKAYSTVCGSLRTFRHYSREVKSVFRRLDVHQCIFLNECRLLLRLVEDEHGTEAMLKDKADRRWTSKELNDRLNAVLGPNFQPCQSIIEETKDTIDELRVELMKFDVLKDGKEQGESIKSAIKRLRDAVKITFDESKYRKSLAELRDRNADLKHLRSQIGAFQQQSTCPSRTLPTRFKLIQDASRKLHEALCSAQYCVEPGHREHSAKLCLDAEIQAEVRLDLGISCHEASGECNSEAPIWLYVQSTIMGATECATRVSSAGDVAQLSPQMQLKKKASSDLTESTTCGKKRKRVRFLGNNAEEALFTSPSVTGDLPPACSGISPQGPLSLLNLCQSNNICQYLRRTLHARNGSIPSQCVGYLETPQMYRHLFYYQKDALSATARQKDPKRTAFFSIPDIMGQDPDDVLSIKDQLKLAHRTAIAVLQFHDTPWLPKHWRLQEISYLGTRGVFDETTLKTLHLSSQLSSSIHPDSHSLAMEGVQCAEATVSEEVQLGINNTTLFYLGVALLEIAHWKSLEEKMTPRDLNNPVFAARRLASARIPLGPDYARIAQKCLQCNFGFGTELSSKGLQAAVYSDVVCQIEKMMDSLQLSI